MKWLLTLILSLGVSAALAAPSPDTDWEALGKRWWSHVQFLADDKLQGRDTGSAGYKEAAEYVTRQFREAGLRPAGVNGYSQPVEFSVSVLDEAASSLELVRGGKAEPVVFGEDGFLIVNPDTAPRTEAEAVFVGYGLSIPEAKHDDLQGMDLKGKIAVYVTGGPASIPSAVNAHFSSYDERRKALLKAGVAGIATIFNPLAQEVPWSRTAGARFNPRMAVRDLSNSRLPGFAFSMAINPQHADKFFAGSGHSFAEVLEAMKAEKPLPHFPLAVKFRARVGAKQSSVQSENIAGLLPGSDPALAKETVVLSAHLDHVGVGQAVNGDSIYNGAMDDASGVASLIEIARSMKETDARPGRSILFLAVTGEEKGLLGSKYFAAHPTVEPKSIVADINMDMVLPLFAFRYLEVLGLEESTLGDDVRETAAAMGVQVQTDKEPLHNRFIRSDQYNFILHGVPALAFKFGWLPGTPEEKIFKDWYMQRYHGPADDANQPVNFAGAGQFNALIRTLALRVAGAPRRPQWKSGSFFRRFAQ